MRACPTREELERFLDADPESASLSQHIDECAACQEALDQLTRAFSVAAKSNNGRDSIAHTLSQSHTDFLGKLKENPPKQTQRSDRADARNPTRQFPTIAGYKILDEIGRGGMGVVYKAKHLGLDRLVALKMILAGPHAGAKEIERFRQEAEAVARLHHPHIIQIYDIGESAGRPFLALEYVDGESLAHLLNGTPQPLEPAAQLIETLANAIQNAHQQGVIHRDLKPANILLEGCRARKEPRDDQETPCLAPRAGLPSAIPKIADFGLAKRLDHHPSGSQSGEVVGTPSYMAPEQASQDGREIGPAADVYALGAILYELLTGRPPFRGPNSLDTVLQLLHEEPVRPSALRRDLPRDLETICLKCLAKDPHKRYADAKALAEDIYRFRKGQPIKARPVSVHERAWKWAKHRPATASLAAALLLVALLSYSGITWLWQQARLARDDMEYERGQAEIARDKMNLEWEQAEKARQNEAEQRRQARVSLYFSRIAQSQLRWRLNDYFSAEQSLVKCLPEAGAVDDRGWEWRYLQGLFHNDLFTLPHGYAGFGGWAAYDAKGARIATVVSGPAVGETPQASQVRVWNARTGGLINTWTGPGTLHRVLFHPHSDRLAMATMDGAVVIWDATSGKEIARRELHRGAVWALAFNPKGEWLASAGSDGRIKIWDSANEKIRLDIRALENPIQSIAFHPSDPIIAAGGSDGTVKLWNATTGEEVKSLPGHKMAVTSVAFNPDGKSLVSASSNGNIKIWNLDSGQVAQSLTGDTGGILCVAYSPDGRYLAKAGRDGSVRIWHITTGVERMAFRGHNTPAESVQFSPDCQHVVSISPGDGVAKVWDLTRHPEFATFARTDADVEAIAFAKNGQHLVSVTSSGKLQSWDTSTGMLLDERIFPLNKTFLSPAVPASLSKNGRYLVGGNDQDSRIAQLWDTEKAGATIALRGHTDAVRCVRFSNDARLIATCACPTSGASFAHEIIVWNAGTGERLTTITGKGRVFNLAFSPDSRVLAYTGQYGSVTLATWNSPQDNVVLAAHDGDVTGLAFSTDGNLLASAGMEDRCVKLWKVASILAGERTALQTMSAPNLICDLAFSPDGRRLAAGSRDMVKLWDVDSGHEALTLRGATQRFWDPDFNPRVAFSPDGAMLAGTNWNESISLWQAPPLDNGEQIARFQESRRQFSELRSNLWHLQEAELCMQYKNVVAARFHLSFVGNDARTGPLRSRKDRLDAAIGLIPKMQ